MRVILSQDLSILRRLSRAGSQNILKLRETTKRLKLRAIGLLSILSRLGVKDGPGFLKKSHEADKVASVSDETI